MKQVWVKIRNWDKEIILSAIESGADAVWIDGSHVQEAKKLGRIPVIADSGDPDYLIGRDILIYEINSPQDQEKIIELAREVPVLVRTRDWHIIPLENLV
ncbi:MAG: 3-dehydroquinate synthase II, partial [Desulfatiglandales bacterium]